MLQTIDNKIVTRIYGNGRAWAFSQKDFVDLGGTSTIHWVLHELEKAGTIRRVLRGLYNYPRISKLLDAALPPDIHLEARAMREDSEIRCNGGEERELDGKFHNALPTPKRRRKKATV